MGARNYDRQLGIKTEGLREWRGHSQYNRYEATPYEALDKLFKAYRLKKGDQVVDFGCGRGRVVFYIHNKFKVPVSGIEAHDKTFAEALINKENYLKKAAHPKAPIQLQYGLAEHYEIKPEDNCFYLFNPFTHRVFKKVVENMVQSVKEAPRTIDLILYYPLREYKKVLKKKTSFRLINKVRVPGLLDFREKFLIYRWPKEEEA